jgi:hypothetical protein
MSFKTHVRNRPHKYTDTDVIKSQAHKSLGSIETVHNSGPDEIM